MEYQLWDRLLGEINRQLEAKNIIISKGRINIIDATLIESAHSGNKGEYRLLRRYVNRLSWMILGNDFSESLL